MIRLGNLARQTKRGNTMKLIKAAPEAKKVTFSVMYNAQL
ncbi:hypothetical protein TPA0906_55390 [Streptomyces olivaceus]|nr:hypothetical protein TPA0906_55390 [Streptomyces olivaceus]